MMVAWFAMVTPVLAQPDAAKIAFFESKIRPVLVTKCVGCHSAEAEAQGKLKGGLYLDSRNGWMQGGHTGPAIMPGDPSRSLLTKALRHEVHKVEMPPDEKRLDARVIADFEQWIRDGAHDPRDGATPVARKRVIDLSEGRKLWSLQAPRQTLPPTVKWAAWARGGIDRFILARLEQEQLTPNSDADSRTLLRRVHLDLTGLPPSPEEAEAFQAQHLAPVVDRLLASPHFGERWGRHWLDAARYADSNGRDRNVIFYHAWRYRDYVIRAFNEDKPYDQFLREQIAGDLMQAKSASQRDEMLTATAFLALGAKSYEEAKPEVFRMDMIDEQIETISRTILGLSVACARCHDHKFDPIPTADYYALAGILRSTQALYGYGTLGIRATAFHHTQWHALADEGHLAPAALEYHRRHDAAVLAMHEARSSRYRISKGIPEMKRKLTGLQGEEKEKAAAGIAAAEAQVAEWNVKVQALEQAVEAIKDMAPPQPAWSMGARDADVMEDCRIHIRGETTNLGAAVPRGFLQAISIKGTRPPSRDHSGRAELAHWLAHRDNPLTARVMVNRVWQKLFGRALVTTLDDFGVNGATPSHPELLDHLALKLMDDGWSLKSLIREMVLSRAYQMSSEASPHHLERDPDNILLWRMSPRVLDAEVLRDSMLTLSDRLEAAPPVKQFLDRFHPQRDYELSTFKPFLTSSAIEDTHRSIYLPVVRGTLPEIFTLFNFAAPERPVAQRDESILPAQSLFLMNNPWVIHQARETAGRVLARAGDDADRLRQLHLLAFARPPTTLEMQRSLSFLSHRDQESAQERWTTLCQILFASAEFRIVQ